MARDDDGNAMHISILVVVSSASLCRIGEWNSSKEKKHNFSLHSRNCDVLMRPAGLPGRFEHLISMRNFRNKQGIDD